MLQFRIQSTPNPNARKYIINRDLKAHGKVSYRTLEECMHVPLAEALLSMDGVTQIHFFENVLTLTQDGTKDWSILDHGAQTLVIQNIDKHDIFFEDFPQKPEKDKTLLSPDLQRIDAILESTVRPGLQADGGDIEVVELDGNILSVRYMGACGGCPSSMLGTLEAIKGILQEEFHPDIEIVTV